MKPRRNSIKLSDKELTVSIGVLGERGVGKTALLTKWQVTRLTKMKIPGKYRPTGSCEKFTRDFKLFSFQVETKFYDYCKIY